MTDERKQEQQRKLRDLMEAGLDARRSRYISRDERQALEHLEDPRQAPARRAQGRALRSLRQVFQRGNRLKWLENANPAGARPAPIGSAERIKPKTIRCLCPKQ
jgi:hypothetical protein